jgi:L-threonylcarbamoyladenylate synthase
MSPVYDCTTESGRAEGVAKAVEAVRGGKVVVIPTDTVYGVGADAFSEDAVAAVLAAKGRGRDMPPPVLVPNVRTVDGLATDVPPWARDLIREFWPGPLTLVFQAQSSLMWDLGETNGTVALRMPQDDIALEVLAEVGPMAVTSANQSGHPAATTITDAAAQLGAAVAVYLDAGRRADNVPSTIVDCTGERPEVLREGAISRAQLDAVLDTHFPAESAAEGVGEAPAGDGPEPAAQGVGEAPAGESPEPAAQGVGEAPAGDGPEPTAQTGAGEAQAGDGPEPATDDSPRQPAHDGAEPPTGDGVDAPAPGAPEQLQDEAIELPANPTPSAGERP